MTTPNAPTERRHRELAANRFDYLLIAQSHRLMPEQQEQQSALVNWIETGLCDYSGVYSGSLPYGPMSRQAQSLANLEAAVRREYAGLVSEVGLVAAELHNASDGLSDEGTADGMP